MRDWTHALGSENLGPDHWKAREFPRAFLKKWGQERRNRMVGWGEWECHRDKCVTVLTNWFNLKNKIGLTAPIYFCYFCAFEKLHLLMLVLINHCLYLSLTINLAGGKSRWREKGISLCSLTSMFVCSLMEKKSKTRNRKRERAIYTNDYQSMHSRCLTTSLIQDIFQ